MFQKKDVPETFARLLNDRYRGRLFQVRRLRWRMQEREFKLPHQTELRNGLQLWMHCLTNRVWASSKSRGGLSQTRRNSPWGRKDLAGMEDTTRNHRSTDADNDRSSSKSESRPISWAKTSYKLNNCHRCPNTGNGRQSTQFLCGQKTIWSLSCSCQFGKRKSPIKFWRIRQCI